MKIIKFLEYPFKLLFKAFIWIYKLAISPLLPKTCRYLPTCSNYALQAIDEFGIIKGTYLAIKRVLRCNPRHECGVDPVPCNIKGDIRWLI